MASKDDKARQVFRDSLTKARTEILKLMAGDPLPQEMHEDVLDVLEHIEAVLEGSETPSERDDSIDESIKAIERGK
jgi:hypothetical protein